jgi:hypothetical protein
VTIHYPETVNPEFLFGMSNIELMSIIRFLRGIVDLLQVKNARWRMQRDSK